jgi:hypothetical protein
MTAAFNAWQQNFKSTAVNGQADDTDVAGLLVPHWGTLLRTAVWCDDKLVAMSGGGGLITDLNTTARCSSQWRINY